MIKIVHIITRLDMGGSAQNTLLTCHKLSSKYQMVLAHGTSQESKMTDSERRAVAAGIENASKNGVRVILVSSLVRRLSPVNDFRTLCSLVRLIRKEKPKIVHTHTSKAGILGRLAAKIANVPYIVHTPHGHVFYGHFGPVLSRVFLRLEQSFSSFIDRLVALTDGENKDYIDLSVCPPEKLLSIHSGVDIEKFSTAQVDVVAKKRSLGLEENGGLVGFIGWLLPVKGPMHLLKAMKDVWQEHPETVLVFVGKGDLEDELRSEARKLSGDGRVRFLGWRDDVAEIMPVFDTLVVPSLNEGMGRVVVEAMAAGKPVVASRVGGIPDLVQHGINGLLVPPGDEKALAASVKQLLKDPAKAQSMGRRGRESCHQFSLEAMIAKVDALYSDLIPNSTGSTGVSELFETLNERQEREETRSNPVNPAQLKHQKENPFQ